MTRLVAEMSAFALLIAISAALYHPSAVTLHLGVSALGAARFGYRFVPLAVLAALAGLICGWLVLGIPISPSILLDGFGIAVAAGVARLLAPDPGTPADWRGGALLLFGLVLLPATLHEAITHFLWISPALPGDIAGCLFAMPLLVLTTIMRKDAIGFGVAFGLTFALTQTGAAGMILLTAGLAGAAVLFPLSTAGSVILGAGLALTQAPEGTGPTLVATALAALVIAWQTDVRRLALLDAEERVERRNARLRYLLRSRDEATALAVHDLQSPIEAMGGMHRTLLHMLEQDRLDPEAMKNALAIAAETTEELSDRIGSVLSTDRAHLGFGGPGDRLAAVVDQALAGHRLRLAEKEIDLELRQDSRVRIAHADDVRDVLDVLIDNALVHTPRRGKIAVTLNREPGFLVLSVSDSGPGVSQGSQAGLFSCNVSPDAGRRGMGLYLAARRTRLIGGSLTYAPSEFGGAMFLLRLRDTL